MTERGYLRIEFGEEASESFANVVTGFRGYCVELTPADSSLAPFDAVLSEWTPLASDSGWYDAVSFRRANDDGEPIGAVEVLRVASIKVY